MQLTVKQVEPETAQITDSLNLTIGISIRISGDRYSTRALHGDRYCCVKSEKLLPLGELSDLANDFQDLVSIATGHIAAFDKIVVSHPDVAIEASDGRMHPQRIGAYQQWRAVAESDGKPPEHYDLYFTYQDFGGVEGVARWMNAAGAYRGILGRLMTTRYNRHSYPEDQAFNRFVALEASIEPSRQVPKGDTTGIAFSSLPISPASLSLSLLATSASINGRNMS